MIANATEIDAVIEKLETAVIADKMARSDEFGPSTELDALAAALVEAVKIALYGVKTVMVDASNTVGTVDN